MTDDRPYIEIEFTGTTLTQHYPKALIGTNIVIDYDDGNIVNYNGDYSHDYSENGTYTIRIYGVTSLGNYCFVNCIGLTSVIIPSSITSLGDYCFYRCLDLASIVIPDSVTSIGESCFRDCSGLIDIQFNWFSSTDIPTYNSNWISNTDSSLVFSIPYGTTSLYSAKGYPSEKLVERTSNVSSHELFSDVKALFLNNKEVKSIVIDKTNGGTIYEKTTTLITTNLTIEVPALVYSDTFDVTGLLTDNNNNPISGASVKLYRDNNILEATETTDNNGEVTFHRNAPTSITSYDFQLKYDGDTYHNSSDSSVVTRVVNKETSILNITKPINESTYINDGKKITVTGNLFDNDGNPLENKNIQIKRYNDRITTLTTNENGDFLGVIPFEFLDVGENELNFIFNEEEFYTGSTQTVTINVEETIPTNLTIEVPALVYSDVFNITGRLTDENGEEIGGAIVKLIRDGSILEATDTTDLNGEVTFQRNAPTTITTYTFQLIFDGDSDYNNSSSSVVTRKVNAETTILNLTSPLNNATYNEGETIPIAGTITTDDGEKLSSENPLIVTVYDENNNRLTVLPIVNGAFSRNITAPSSAGNHSITVKFEGASTALLPPDEEPQVPSTPDEEPSSVPSVPETEEPPEPQLIYAPSEATRSYTVTPDSLTLTSNKNILSQADYDVATLTATLSANDKVGKEVIFSTDVLKSTTVSASGTYNFGDYFEISYESLMSYAMGNEESKTLLHIGEYISNSFIEIEMIKLTPSNSLSIRVPRAVYNLVSGIRIEENFLIFDSYSNGNTVHQRINIDTVNLRTWNLGEGVSVSVDECGFYGSATTNSDGVATAYYTSKGAGDITITATYRSKQATCSISDYPAIYIDNCDGTQKEIFTTTAEGGTYKTFSYTTYGGYQCLHHNTNFGWYPPSSSGNMLIEFDMYPRGSWGGTSIKGANGTRLVWYMQGSQYNDMSYQIAVKVPSQWNKCKILIQDGVVTAWLNDNQIGQITTTVTHPLYDEMGSGTNPCYIKNLKIIELP